MNLKKVGEAMKTKDGMIDNINAVRIRDDAYIACDALQALVYAPNLHEDYIKEKLDVVRHCIKFIENYETKDKEKTKDDE